MLHRHAGPAVAGSYTAGALCGALTTASVLFLVSGLLSPVPGALRGTIAVAVLVLLLAQFTGLICLDLPQNGRQIPRETFTSSPPKAAFRFAFELGTGVRTYITANAPYAVAILVALTLPADLASAAVAVLAIAMGYAIGRSVVVASQSLRRSVAVDHPQHWLRASELVALGFALAVAITFLSAI